MIWSKSGQTHKERRNTEIQNENEEMRPEYSGANLGELMKSHITPKNETKTKKGVQNILEQICANSYKATEDRKTKQKTKQGAQNDLEQIWANS